MSKCVRDKPVKTDERGIYRFTNLQPGLYKVAVAAAQGFRAYTQSNVPVQANDFVCPIST